MPPNHWFCSVLQRLSNDYVMCSKLYDSQTVMLHRLLELLLSVLRHFDLLLDSVVFGDQKRVGLNLADNVLFAIQRLQHPLNASLVRSLSGRWVATTKKSQERRFGVVLTVEVFNNGTDDVIQVVVRRGLDVLLNLLSFSSVVNLSTLSTASRYWDRKL